MGSCPGLLILESVKRISPESPEKKFPDVIHREVLEEEEGVNRRPDGGIQVCLEATNMIPHPKTSNGWA